MDRVLFEQKKNDIANDFVELKDEQIILASTLMLLVDTVFEVGEEIALLRQSIPAAGAGGPGAPARDLNPGGQKAVPGQRSPGGYGKT